MMEHRWRSRCALRAAPFHNVDMDRLRDILARHSLLDAWAKFEKRFLQP
jgi:hypothetical protein